MRTYIGYTKNVRKDELLKLFDLDYEKDADGYSFFEDKFGADFVDSSSFGVLSKEDYPDEEFGFRLIEKLFPFQIPANSKLSELDYSEVECVFVFLDEATISPREVDGVVILEGHEGDLYE